MKLLTARDRARLLANGRLRRQIERENPDASIDFLPVVKLFTPDAGCIWLLTEIDPGDTDRAFLAARRLATLSPAARAPEPPSAWAADLAARAPLQEPAFLAEAIGR